jgi:hypothetical protein
MRLGAAVVSLLGVVAATLPASRADDDWLVLIGGDTDGYLSPCGCSEPMTGGIRRRATAIEALRNEDRTLILENGGLVAGKTRKDELKSEAMAEFLAEIKADAVNVTGPEASLGKGMLLSLANLAGNRLVSSSYRGGDLPIRPSVAKGPFYVGGASSLPGLPAFSVPETAKKVAGEAEGRAPVLMLSGDLEQAREIARANPGLRLIVYRSHGSPSDAPEKEGETWLVSPGEKGRHLLSLGYSNGKFEKYAAIKLGPEFSDEPEVQRIYKSYLSRVEEEDLLGQVPRRETPGYAGSQACASCHAEAHKVWKSSQHAHALASLDKVGHAKDPDCVKCHVTGLDSLKGFVSRERTPQLADVTCESCHGPSADHARLPSSQRPARSGPKDCVSCHDPENSPNFDFDTYWPRIRH